MTGGFIATQSRVNPTALAPRYRNRSMDNDPHRLDPDHLPTPFTADEIRAACQAGRTLSYRIERAGQEAVIRLTRYVSGDASGAVQESWQQSADGRRLSEPEHERSTWAELQRHASFPAATTRRDEEEIDIPAGRFACLRYVRVDEKGTWRFWFARGLPGQPVRFEQQLRGKTVFSATLLENVPGGATQRSDATERRHGM